MNDDEQTTTKLMADFSCRLFVSLRQMDDDSPWGLRGYALHRNNGTKLTTRDWERAITMDFAKRLSACGIPAKAEVDYPGYTNPGRKPQCDVVASIGDARLWIEAKLITTVWWRTTDTEFVNPRPHDKKGVRGLVKDCQRLLALRPPTATVVGALLIAFETEAEPTNLDHVNRHLVSKDVSRWQQGHTHVHGERWPSKLRGAPSHHQFYTRCWFWWRELPKCGSSTA